MSYSPEKVIPAVEDDDVKAEGPIAASLDCEAVVSSKPTKSPPKLPNLVSLTLGGQADGLYGRL
jgi:hypothetical protein